ncbi:alpha/beta fold hydrolase [Haloferax sp. MBLA0076]|uniref:Alpha/beta fold hydrolase n=1 Tax=Haloferax litoreum TaxID=2666140 RepID=A0A6A8GK04_9EURY|nr:MULTISPECIES: alpha/beta hydrolase [Haloferax]KAB1193853.1 alpha/beta hydrolase [Haloferax sp. CBA1148]MRX22397.1 alpha/beta fold hydrolase [Haloferax litoreum]
METTTREDHTFDSQGVACAGWLYRPTDVENPPVVVMAHGFGGERTWRLPAFAERFSERGLAVFVFDYRTFGASGGTPRNLVDPFNHRADWLEAIDYVRSLSTVDAGRVALWGTSFSGGHVIDAASRAAGIRAVVAQVPFSDGPRTGLNLVRRGGLDYLKKSVVAGLRDAWRAIHGRKPYYIPLVGSPDEFALLNTPDAVHGVEALIPDDEEWDNRCAARVSFTVLTYRPLARARNVNAPVFIAQATNDAIIPASTVDRLVDELDDVERVRYPLGHFDAYVGDAFEEVVDREGRFLERHLTD